MIYWNLRKWAKGIIRSFPLTLNMQLYFVNNFSRFTFHVSPHLNKPSTSLYKKMLEEEIEKRHRRKVPKPDSMVSYLNKQKIYTNSPPTRERPAFKCNENNNTRKTVYPTNLFLEWYFPGHSLFPKTDLARSIRPLNISQTQPRPLCQ